MRRQGHGSDFVRWLIEHMDASEIFFDAGAIPPKGLIYTRQCGWIDLGHARREGAQVLWDDIRRDTVTNANMPNVEVSVTYFQSMKRYGIRENVVRKYKVNMQLTITEQKSIALAIFMDVSVAFDYLKTCEPVSKEQAYAIWDQFGAVGANKNYQFKPLLFPNTLLECGLPYLGRLPPHLNTIMPAVMGNKFRRAP